MRAMLKFGVVAGYKCCISEACNVFFNQVNAFSLCGHKRWRKDVWKQCFLVQPIPTEQGLRQTSSTFHFTAFQHRWVIVECRRLNAFGHSARRMLISLFFSFLGVNKSVQFDQHHTITFSVVNNDLESVLPRPNASMNRVQYRYT